MQQYVQHIVERKFALAQMTAPCMKQASERRNACILLSFGMCHLMPAGNLTVFHGVRSQTSVICALIAMRISNLLKSERSPYLLSFCC